MRSFLFLIGGLLLAAASTFAAPVGDFKPRPASLADAVFARAVERVTFGANVPAEHHASITAAINFHHDRLDATDPAKAAVRAHVMGTGWHASDADKREHLAVGFYKAGNKSGKNLLGGTQHVYRPA